MRIGNLIYWYMQNFSFSAILTLYLLCHDVYLKIVIYYLALMVKIFKKVDRIH